ncbi:hypothetical protein C7N43_04385 [Sphingobacteriales bacterium UPWRP_1]|nr:hypothetical protein B6N25_04925 [Sphingobacteriales bacterium TSM_CSS]PSJ78302.1 hypothetical protein C7N43_04385 [Sphingobacteriales bacterium UPWRP_1]
MCKKLNIFIFLGIISVLENAVFAQCPTGQTQLTITIKTDNYPAETTWRLKNYVTGVILASAGPYTAATTTYTANVCVPTTATVLFEIFDSYGDGICCAYGTGFYTVTTGAVTLISGGEFDDEETRIFTVSPQTKDLLVSKISLQDYILAGSKQIPGTIFNLGTTTVSSYNLNYRVDGGAIQTQTVTAPIAPGASYNFTHSTPWLADFGNHNIEVWASGLDGGADLNPENDKLTKNVYSAFELGDRLVLLEHFTQASCGPCAAQNPAMQAVLAQQTNSGKYAHISYHTSWPGYDPMYNQNTADPDARVDYYGVSGVPDVFVDGTIEGPPGLVSTSLIAQQKTIPATCNVRVQESLAGNTATINVTITSLVDMKPGTYKLYIAIVEQMVDYTTAPGSNGEKNFPNVLRKLLPTNGTTVPVLMSGETFTATQTFTFPSYVDATDSRTVVFLQDNNNKSILQTYKTPGATGTNSWVESSILSATGVRAKAKIYLEGAYNAATGSMNTLLLSGNLLPTSQPYNSAPWYYNGTENVTNFPANTVDWVLVELVDDSYNTIARRAAFIRSDGQLIDVNGSVGVLFLAGVTAGSNYRLQIHHRNHLSVMSGIPVYLPNTASFDFSNLANVAGQEQTKQVAPNIYALWTGDCFNSGTITHNDFNKYFLQSGLTGYMSADLNLDGVVTISDFNLFKNNAGRIAIPAVR